MEVFANPNLPRIARLQACADLCQAIVKYGQQQLVPDKPKLPTLLALIDKCRPVYAQESEESVRAAAAKILGNLHRQAHVIYKPDDLARASAVQIYTNKKPAAAAAAQAIVIYPTHRPGAPGF